MSEFYVTKYLTYVKMKFKEIDLTKMWPRIWCQWSVTHHFCNYCREKGIAHAVLLFAPHIARRYDWRRTVSLSQHRLKHTAPKYTATHASECPHHLPDRKQLLLSTYGDSGMLFGQFLIGHFSYGDGKADPSGRAVYGVGLRPLSSWDCGFESHRGAWMSVSCERFVLSCRGPCVVLITRPEEPYCVWCVWVC